MKMGTTNSNPHTDVRPKPPPLLPNSLKAELPTPNPKKQRERYYFVNKLSNPYLASGCCNTRFTSSLSKTCW